jgi:hypothetical protein
MSVFRYPWDDFPKLWLHACEHSVKKHPAYQAAKSGDPSAALDLVHSTISRDCIETLALAFADMNPVLVSAHAVESHGVNAIPQAMAGYLGCILSWPVETSVVQSNVVGHTGADGFSRLARQAEFDGAVSHRSNYVLVDDFVGQGGTLANLRGFLIHCGGTVIGGTVLTGKSYSVILNNDEQQIVQLREKHGSKFESWWIERFGFGYDCLTYSEARYLLNTPTAQRIRNQITAAI